MSELMYLVEQGGQRDYVSQADLAARLKDGWALIGRRTVGAEVKQSRRTASADAPKAASKSSKKDEPAG